jgi:hypothetical protein
VKGDFGLHENYRDAGPVAGGSDRSFGLTVGGVLLAFGAAKGLLAGAVTLTAVLCVVIGAVLLLFGIIAPARLTRLSRLWLRLGMALAAVVNPLILALLFYLVFSPMALVLRLVGKRPLRLQREPAAASYWLAREPQAGSDMRRQF